MPNGESTVNVRDVVEMGSHGDEVSRLSYLYSEWQDEPPKQGATKDLRRDEVIRVVGVSLMVTKKGIGDMVIAGDVPISGYQKVGVLSLISCLLLKIPREDLPSPEVVLQLERETNNMTHGELDRLRESCTFHPVFRSSFPRRILHIYNIYPAQLVPNAWHSVVCAVVSVATSYLSLPRPNNRGSIESWIHYSKDKPTRPKTSLTLGSAVQVVGDEGESYHSQDDPLRGGKVRPLIPGLESGSLSLSSSSEAWLNPQLPFELRLKEKLLKGVIVLADRDEVERLDLDWAISKFFHIIGQACAALVEVEMAHAQQLAKKFERQLAELRAKEQHAIKEFRNANENRDATMERLKKEVAELKEKSVLTKKSAIEEYKSSDDFHEVVEQSASMYFGEGFELLVEEGEGEEDEEEPSEEKEEKNEENGEQDNNHDP
ncbi:hypothetical protein Acr_00g0011680 [Actinidia rufa]|uniref:Uncharacterized protein n=1 Tax=Actinidia rufa TaxID=165716 RepID=A0A7J0D9Q4_9ERIC|nr:hypothetical protein Acr_00g0011680 [Actinidia rufa]